MLNPFEAIPCPLWTRRPWVRFEQFFFNVNRHERDYERRRDCERVGEREVWMEPEFRREIPRHYDEILDDLLAEAMRGYRPS